jgi:hypothetical protein
VGERLRLKSRSSSELVGNDPARRCAAGLDLGLKAPGQDEVRYGLMLFLTNQNNYDSAK